MHHQRIGRQRQEFVEQQEGDQIAGQRDPQRGGHAEAEEAEEAVSLRRVLQIADGVDRRGKPEDGGQEREKHREGIGPQHEIDAGQKREANLVALTLLDAPEHDGHEQQLQHDADQV